MPAAEAERELAVDDVVDARLEVGEDRCPLGRRQPAGGDLLVEIGLGRGDERLLEPRRGLAVRLRDLGERVAVLEAGAELRLGDAEIVGCRREVDEAVVAAAMTEAGPDPDQRNLTGFDPLLELRCLRRRDRSCLRAAASTRFSSACFSAASSLSALTPSCFAASATIASLSSVGESWFAATAAPPPITAASAAVPPAILSLSAFICLLLSGALR